ncbi:MAG: 16S rRNA (uracil(1498)-N(3))-methyltransferase [Treponema sp.]|jgi:RsmE family RNA methyltransferase|nr:16S rRNA (uracil(1498)-N(3))-methyltransferase [Treponema sp.]
MNLILFEERELGRPLPRRDERTAHLLKTLRKKPGDMFDAGILGGQRGAGTIEKINLDGSLVYSLRLFEDPPRRFSLRMAVGFPRPIQLRRLLRDLSSLGISAVDLVGTDLGDKNYRNTNLLKDGGARSALIEGAAQSRDTTIPGLAVWPRLEDWLGEHPWEQGEPRPRPLIFLAAADNIRPEGSLARISAMRRKVVLAVGPERGWSDRERELFGKSGFLRLSLGERALRTETACVAAAALMLEKIGELG